MDEKWLGLIPKLCYIVTKTFGDFVRDSYLWKLGGNSYRTKFNNKLQAPTVLIIIGH